MAPAKNSYVKVRINRNIRAKELRVIGAEGENLGVISRDEAVAKAEEVGLDLIEISPNATPPVAKITDYGKYQYDLKRKARDVKRKSHVTEVKNIQVKIGTGEHDLSIKAKKASEWLKEGHRVKFDLYLRGRAKYLEKDFLKERMDRMMNLISVDFKVADGPKQSPKGLTMILEKK